MRAATSSRHAGRVLRLAGVLALSCVFFDAPTTAAAQSSMEIKGGFVSYACVQVSDLDRALKFYVEGLGMTRMGVKEHPGDTSVAVGYPGSEMKVVLVRAKSTDAKWEGRGEMNRLILSTPDLRLLQSRLVAAGYTLSRPVTEVKPGLVVGSVSDPDGNRFELLQMNR